MANSHLQDEAEIIWLVDDISRFPYVREQVWETTRRNQKPPKSSIDQQTIGYSTVKDSVKRSIGQNYYRRLFFLCPQDRANDPNGVTRIDAFKVRIW